MPSLRSNARDVAFVSLLIGLGADQTQAGFRGHQAYPIRPTASERSLDSTRFRVASGKSGNGPKLTSLPDAFTYARRTARNNSTGRAHVISE